MNRRSFLKLLGISATVLALPLNSQNKVIRDGIKNRIKIIDSYNVKNVEKVGVGQYTINFETSLDNSFNHIQISGESSVVKHDTKKIDINAHTKGNTDVICSDTHGCRAWVRFEGINNV